MRLWHKDLIPVLPRQQLLGQWRECCLIAKNIKEKGTPNHLLVNKIMDYPIGHFWKYGYLIREEMFRRGYKCDFHRFEQWFDRPWRIVTPEVNDLFADWHTDRYMNQCLMNLQEKFDCDGIGINEYMKIIDFQNEWLERFENGC